MIAHNGPPAGIQYRVIGTDGVERDMAGLPDWIAAIRSDAVEGGCLFLDGETARWRPVSHLDVFNKAIQAVDIEARGGKFRHEAVDLESCPSALQDPVSDSESFTKQARNSMLLWGVSAAVVLVALAAWSAGPGLQATVEAFIRQIPKPALIAGAAVLFVLLAEEFYWFAVILVGVRSTGATRRFALQVLSLLTTGLLLYVAFAFLSAEGFQRSFLRFFASNVAIVGVVYAVSLFLWSIPLFRGTDATPARKALASTVASAMVAGTLYMAVVPSVRNEAAPTPTRTAPRPSGATMPSPLPG
ncbi:MAG TPA: hypothetical protein VKP67_01740 [Xanthobacteraceae bacterium]|nr:hypothetical protein [Xanthobacteraceae bacterium]